MNLNEYANLVKKMREKQKAFFRNKHKRHLVDSKQLEKDVDQITEEILKQQTNLF